MFKGLKKRIARWSMQDGAFETNLYIDYHVSELSMNRAEKLYQEEVRKSKPDDHLVKMYGESWSDRTREYLVFRNIVNLYERSFK